MKGIASIWKKEMQAYFLTPVGYVFMGLFMAGAALFFIRYNLAVFSADFNSVMSNMVMMFLFAIPILTMRLFSDERRNKTDQLLLTSPISVTGLVIGKYLAALTMFACVLVLLLVHVAILAIFGNPYFTEIAVGYLGYALLGAALIALGMFISSLMENQIAAAFATLGVMLAIYLIGFLTYVVDIQWIVTLINWLSVFSRYSDFGNAILSLSPIVYYISFAALFVFLTIRAIEKRRWSEN